jgi:hypothetical protein
MSIIKTERNTVYALEPLPEDSFVQTYLGTPEGRELLTTCHVDDYSRAVADAVRMADRMEYPVTLVPITAGRHRVHAGGAARLR